MRANDERAELAVENLRYWRAVARHVRQPETLSLEYLIGDRRSKLSAILGSW